MFVLVEERTLAMQQVNKSHRHNQMSFCLFGQRAPVFHQFVHLELLQRQLNAAA